MDQYSGAGGYLMNAGNGVTEGLWHEGCRSLLSFFFSFACADVVVVIMKEAYVLFI